MNHRSRSLDNASDSLQEVFQGVDQKGEHQASQDKLSPLPVNTKLNLEVRNIDLSGDQSAIFENHLQKSIDGHDKSL